MPCFSPNQASYSVRPDGKKDVRFSRLNDYLFRESREVLSRFDVVTGEVTNLQLPCGKCEWCKMERSRQWAVRCADEVSLYDQSCFFTLTFSPVGMSEIAPTGSLSKRHVQLFMKRVRKRFSERKIRFFICGEYGPKLGRPHYHGLLFNLDFDDKQYYKTVNGHDYYISETMSELWPYGFITLGEANFETAAYIARYCLKKVNGSEAEVHYSRTMADGKVVRLESEFLLQSTHPGIGAGWFDKYGMTDVYPRDEKLVRGVMTRPPRYYDKLLERVNPELYAQVKQRRVERAFMREDDNTHERLMVKQKLLQLRLGKLVRSMEAKA